MLRGGALRYELAERSQGIGCGGIGAMQQLVRRIGLARTIDQHVRLLKLHVPYHESDHVLNLAYNVLCGGRVLADIELRRQDGAFLAALGTQSIPDPTTAGDFRRRFGEDDIWALMAAIDEPRLSVWRQHPTLTQQRARIDGDGTMVPTTGECKEGMDISHKGTWGYHPLLVSLSAAPTLVIPASSRYRLGERESAALPKRSRPPKRGAHQGPWPRRWQRRGKARGVPHGRWSRSRGRLRLLRGHPCWPLVAACDGSMTVAAVPRRGVRAPCW